MSRVKDMVQRVLEGEPPYSVLTESRYIDTMVSHFGSSIEVLSWSESSRDGHLRIRDSHAFDRLAPIFDPPFNGGWTWDEEGSYATWPDAPPRGLREIWFGIFG